MTYIASLTIMATCSLITSIFLLLLFIPLFCKRKTSQLPAIQKYGAILCTLSAILCCIFDFGHTFASIPDNVHIDDESQAPVTTAADIMYFCSSMTLYIILFDRIHKSFENTMYEVSKLYLVLLSTMIAIYGIFILIYILMVATSQEGGFVYYAIFLFIELVISISLLVEFVNKLKQIILDQVDADLYDYVVENEESVGQSMQNHTGNSPELGSHKMVLDTKQIAMITLITKITVLSVIAIIGVQIFWISVIVSTALCNYELSHEQCDTDRIQPILYAIRAVTLANNIIILYLNFDFNVALYTRVCKCCHMRCYRLCSGCLQKRIMQRQLSVSSHYQML